MAPEKENGDEPINEKSSPGRRWHDDQGELSTMMELLDSIPAPLRPLITEALNERAEQDFQMAEILKSFKSLGKEKIMALHQAQKKRRSYDQDPDLHQIANLFFAMPENQRQEFAGRFLEFISLTVEYLANCDTFGLEPAETDLKRMRTLYVRQGDEAVRNYLHALHQPYYELMLQETAPTAESGDPTIIVADEKGLRLKDN